MKNLLTWVAIICIAAAGTAEAQQAMNWHNDSNNYQNNINNMENSPNNMRNSPNNWDNNPNNLSATNGVYDNSGNRVGYEIKAPSGVTNYYDNSGNRVGYVPAKR